MLFGCRWWSSQSQTETSPQPVVVWRWHLDFTVPLEDFLPQSLATWCFVASVSGVVFFFSNNADHVLWSPSPGSRLPAPYGCVWWEHPEESVLPGAGEAETGPLQSGGRTSRHREYFKPRCVFVGRTERNCHIDSFTRKRKPVLVFNISPSEAGFTRLPGTQWFLFFFPAAQIRSVTWMCKQKKKPHETGYCGIEFIFICGSTLDMIWISASVSSV